MPPYPNKYSVESALYSVENTTQSAINSTNYSTKTGNYSTIRPSVEVGEIPHETPQVVELGIKEVWNERARQSEESTKQARKFANYALMGEEELAMLSRVELQAYKNSESKKKAEYTKRNSPNLVSVKMRLATIDRAQELQKQRGVK